MTKVVEGECVAAVHYLTGEILSAGSGRCKARRILEQREGPPPFHKAVCRHLCKNDSMAPNGFVCTRHTTWGTYSENMMDRSPENRAKGVITAGFIGCRNGGKIGGKVAKLSPLNAINIEVTCPHCGKVGTKLPMSRWHFDNCKLKPHN